MNSTLLFYQYLCWKSIQGKTSSLNSSSIHGKRVQQTRFLIRSCLAGCLIRSGCVCTWWLLRQDQIVSSTWWRTWSNWAASALDGCVCTWSNRVSNGALDQIMFAVKKKYTRKTSSTNSFSLYGRRVRWTRLPWTRFLCFVPWNCYKWNWVQRSWIAINEISFKPCLTYNIVWVLCLF